MTKRVRIGVLALGVIVACVTVLGSCAGAPAPRGEPAGSTAKQTKKAYATAGRALSMLAAMNQCSIEAIKLAVVDIIGPEWAEKYHPQLSQILYNTSNPNAYIFSEETETTRKDRAGEEYIFERRVMVNMVAVESTLRANGIVPGSATSGAVAAATTAGATGGGAAAAVSGAAAAPSTASPAAASTAEEQEVIRRYVEKMTYLVYFNEESAPDAFAAKMAVGVANEYLVSNTMEAVDFDQVQRLKKDQEKVYQEQSGKDMTLIQWIAQKLNADVYIEIDAKSTGESSGSGGSARHYGQANISIKAFEASTGRLLGTQNWNSPKTTSLASQDDAKLNAVQASVNKTMPVVIDQAKAYMGKALQSGIKYELVLQNTSDTKVVNDFRKKLLTRVKDVKTVSQTAEETRYDVWLIGTMEDLVDMVLEVKEVITGMEGLELVMMRSKSATFDAGL